VLHLFDATVNYLAVGSWLHARDSDIETVAARSDVYANVAGQVAGRQILYLEFGVHEGASIREWSKLLAGEDATLHGFDSFEGLPAPWNLVAPKGHFSTGGAVPTLADQRVKFVPGWFEETLPIYEAPAHDVLVINIDADLYSSTRCVLDNMDSLIVPGTFLYFDEFSDRHHEMRAFDEYLTRTGKSIRVVCATRELSRIAFQILEAPREDRVR
jgi:hypothetical protein